MVSSRCWAFLCVGSARWWYCTWSSTCTYLHWSELTHLAEHYKACSQVAGKVTALVESSRSMRVFHTFCPVEQSSSKLRVWSSHPIPEHETRVICLLGFCCLRTIMHSWRVDHDQPHLLSMEYIHCLEPHLPREQTLELDSLSEDSSSKTLFSHPGKHMTEGSTELVTRSFLKLVVPQFALRGSRDRSYWTRVIRFRTRGSTERVHVCKTWYTNWSVWFNDFRLLFLRLQKINPRNYP